MKRRIFKDLDSYLRQTGTTQATLARRLGVSQTCISLIINGKRTPRPKLMLAIAAEARIPIDTLFAETVVSDTDISAIK